MASYHRILKVFGRSVDDKTLQCDCDIHPWEITVNGSRLSGRIRLIGYVDLFFLISYSENSRFHDGIVIYKDDQQIEKLLELAGKEFKDLLPKNLEHTTAPAPTEDQALVLERAPTQDTPPPQHEKASPPAPNQKYTTFSRDTVDYIITSVGHPIGLRTAYHKSSLKKYRIQLRKPQDPLLKHKYKRALKQHDTLDMIRDAMKLGLVSYAEILGHGMGHIYRASSTQDLGKGFVGGLGAGKESWSGLSGDKS